MKILLLNQCFYPDVVATAQHMSDLAVALQERGHEVSVLASSRGYDNSELRFPAEETWNGIGISRVPTFGTGKGSRMGRALNILSFFVSGTLRLLFTPKADVVVALTSPPLVSCLAALLVRLRGGRFVFWVMDLNPDEAIAAGWLKRDSGAAWLLEKALRFSAHSADRIVVLDRFMRDLLQSKEVAPSKLALLPPWSHDNEVGFDAEGRQRFRAKHGLEGKYVVMYSGNHSPCHPLDTVLQAAAQLANRDDVVFCFVGGGSEFAKVREFAKTARPGRILCLPYQPLAELAGSLSAADLHLVVMGDALVGMVHPCKIYNIMAVGIPVLYIGPDRSHVGDIAEANPELPIARFAHGDVAGVAEHIAREARVQTLPREQMRLASKAFGMDRLLPSFMEVLESAQGAAGRPARGGRRLRTPDTAHEVELG